MISNLLKDHSKLTILRTPYNYDSGMFLLHKASCVGDPYLRTVYN